MPKRILLIAIPLLLIWLGATFVRRTSRPTKPSASPPPAQTFSESKPATAAGPIPGDALLEGYGSPENPPISDLRKLHNVLTGYFSVVKDLTRHPIGGNADLSACLLGENLNRQPFVRPDHPIFNEAGLLSDRWGTALFVHPEAAREITLRSAGPDREMFTDDDLILRPSGLTP